MHTHLEILIIHFKYILKVVVNEIIENARLHKRNNINDIYIFHVINYP